MTYSEWRVRDPKGDSHGTFGFTLFSASSGDTQIYMHPHLPCVVSVFNIVFVIVFLAPMSDGLIACP